MACKKGGNSHQPYTGLSDVFVRWDAGEPVLHTGYERTAFSAVQLYLDFRNIDRIVHSASLTDSITFSSVKVQAKRCCCSQVRV